MGNGLMGRERVGSVIKCLSARLILEWNHPNLKQIISFNSPSKLPLEDLILGSMFNYIQCSNFNTYFQFNIVKESEFAFSFTPL